MLKPHWNVMPAKENGLKPSVLQTKRSDLNIC